MKKILSFALICTLLNAEQVKKKEVKSSCPEVTESSCAAMVAKKSGPNGVAVSALAGLMSVNSRVINTNTHVDIHNKNRYKRFGFGFDYYNTRPNNVFWGVGVDLLTDFGAKTVNATGTTLVLPVDANGQPVAAPFNIPVPIRYTQKRPFSAVLNGKIGYAYGNFFPYVMFGIRESYVRHESLVTATNTNNVDNDINFGIQPGLGFMYKVGSFGLGAEYAYHKESTFGLDDKANNGGEIKNKGCHSFVVRFSYFI